MRERVCVEGRPVCIWFLNWRSNATVGESNVRVKCLHQLKLTGEQNEEFSFADVVRALATLGLFCLIVFGASASALRT